MEHLPVVCFLFIIATPLTLNDLGELQACLVPIFADWENLANALKLAEEVPGISGRDDRDCLGKLLKIWLNQGHCTFEVLYAALDLIKQITSRKVGVDNAVTKLENFQCRKGMYINSLHTVLVFRTAEGNRTIILK